MPRGCPWLQVGHYFRDDICSQNMSMFIARDGRGDYYVRIEGDESQTERIGSVVHLISFFEDYGDDILYSLRNTLACLTRTESACDMIDVRLARFWDSVKVHTV